MIQSGPVPSVSSLDHRVFRDDEFWQEIPAWKDVSREDFGNHLWQSKNAVRKLSNVKDVLASRISDELMSDIEAGLKIAPMNIRITPYVFALIDWDNPLDDPLRKQFLPIASQMLPDHPYYLADSLYEDVDSPVAMLTHRYPDKVLFLPLTTCPFIAPTAPVVESLVVRPRVWKRKRTAQTWNGPKKHSNTWKKHHKSKMW